MITSVSTESSIPNKTFTLPKSSIFDKSPIKLPQKWRKWILNGSIVFIVILILCFIFTPNTNTKLNTTTTSFSDPKSPTPFVKTTSVSGPYTEVYPDFYPEPSKVQTTSNGVLASLIRISIPTRHDCLSIAELEVYDEKGSNIAYRGVPRSSSVFSDIYQPGRALDQHPKTMFSTDCKDTPWFELSFPSDIIISKIVLYNRKDLHKQKILGAVLQLFDSKNMKVFSSTPISGVHDSYTFDFAAQSFPPFLEKSISATTIRFGLTKIAPEFLGISDIKVLNEAGKNIAKHAMIRSSSTYNSNNSIDKLTDGNVHTFFQSQYESQPWIELSFPSDASISQIQIYARADAAFERILSGVLQLWDHAGTLIFTSKPITKVSNVYTFDFRFNFYPN